MSEPTDAVFIDSSGRSRIVPSHTYTIAAIVLADQSSKQRSQLRRLDLLLVSTLPPRRAAGAVLRVVWLAAGGAAAGALPARPAGRQCHAHVSGDARPAHAAARVRHLPAPSHRCCQARCVRLRAQGVFCVWGDRGHMGSAGCAWRDGHMHMRKWAAGALGMPTPRALTWPTRSVARLFA